MNQNFANKISKTCLEFFDKLPKSGKPNNANEWTILSAIVETGDTSYDQMKIIAMATGTKCIGENLLSEKGDILNDSHAEICCRRAFIRYLLWKILESKNSKDNSLFKWNDETKKFQLAENTQFHMFSTALPCGDANIFTVNNDSIEPPDKRIKITDRVGFTGAKLIKCSNSVVEDEMLQTEGAIRIKPGKGVRTLSLSCSDKIARWNIMGIQGCMLSSMLEEPIYLESFVLADGVSFDRDALNRAFYERFSDVHLHLNSTFKHKFPKILISDNGNTFKYSKSETRQNPSATSIIWCHLPTNEKPLEVSVAGKKQGVTKKDLKTSKAHLKISKVELFSQYIKILNEFPELKSHLYSSTINLNDLCYKNMKTLQSNDYFRQWKLLKENYFKVWSNKPENLLNFCKCNE